jgi:hypothetical protein
MLAVLNELYAENAALKARIKQLEALGHEAELREVKNGNDAGSQG